MNGSGAGVTRIAEWVLARSAILFGFLLFLSGAASGEAASASLSAGSREVPPPVTQPSTLITQHSPATVQTRTGTITIPTYLWGPDDVNPQFPQIVGKPIYPYPMQDNLSRKKVDKTYDTLVLENEYLRVTVIPELGGHVHSVFDKTVNKEMFYVNQVIKPGLIGMRGAWISGGIEFNTGPQGHTVTAVSPVSCRFVEFDDGSRAIAVGNIERVFRTQWVAVVRLRPGRCFLEERIRIYNPTPYVQLYYFWNCTAAPNTDGWRFIYPMTLGSDHAGTSFFRWPMDKGVDLTWSKNYRRPTSIFAYQCDQDFFGSYDHDDDHGVVAYANHFDLPGKKAWTWGRGGEGIAAQATLTDDGSLYNEVQTGPLVTQADYGILQPHQTVEWTEWWYPVHGIDGYEFATRDLALNVAAGKDKAGLTIKMIGTGTWENAVCRLVKDGKEVALATVSISPRQASIVPTESQTAQPPFTIEVAADGKTLASFVHPLPLPKREPPDLAAQANPMKTARDHWAAGVLAFKQSKVPEARKHFDKSLELDPDFAPAHLEMAILDLEAGLPKEARPHLEKILERDNDNGLAHYYLARALLELGDETEALEHVWRAARDPASASIGLGVAGEIYIRQRRWAEAIAALERAVVKEGHDILNRNLLTVVLAKAGRSNQALAEAQRTLECDPLDPLAWGFAVAGLSSQGNIEGSEVHRRLQREPQTVLELAALVYRLKEYGDGLELLQKTSLSPGGSATPISCYYAAVFADLLGRADAVGPMLDRAAAMSPNQVFPDRLETIAILKHAARLRPDDWRIYHYLGCLYLAHYRKADAVAAWQKALSLNSNYSVVHRNLGIVRWKLDNDTTTAISHYEKAVGFRPDDLTLYRDLATLYRDSDQWTKVRDLLEKTLGFERYRSDVIELLARAYHRLGEDDKAAALIDSRTFHAWEGQRSLYEIYRDIHIAVGKKAMEAKDFKKAVAAFRRSLEFPPNLGVGRPENVNESEQKELLDKALAAAGEKE
jgi:tetratricopeptide (TPR) repeat protein